MKKWLVWSLFLRCTGFSYIFLSSNMAHANEMHDFVVAFTLPFFLEFTLSRFFRFSFFFWKICLDFALCLLAISLSLCPRYAKKENDVSSDKCTELKALEIFDVVPWISASVFVAARSPLIRAISTEIYSSATTTINQKK